MAKGKAAEKGADKGGAGGKGKAKGKGDDEEKGGKVKGARSINVRHILVSLSAMLKIIIICSGELGLMMTSVRSMQRRKKPSPS
jgi:hypothetical protein